MQKIVIFGGGSGLSQILKGLKSFPIEITAVVSVADNGSSTGELRRELDIPAVGDITKVMLSMSDSDESIVNLLNYRFIKSKTLGKHSVKNLLLTALLDLKGNFDEAIPVLTKMLNVRGTILPLTEDSVHLIAYTNKGKEIFGEEEITKSNSKIVKVVYNKDIVVNPKVYKAIEEADLIVFSSGSLFTSIIPHVIDKKLSNYILKANAKKMYISNLFTQPGETDNLTVSEHVDILNEYFEKQCIDIVIANNNVDKGKLAKKYLTNEQKNFVKLDRDELITKEIELIESNLLIVENGYYRHDSLKVAYLIFRYIMDKN